MDNGISSVLFFFSHREEVMKEDPEKPRKMRRREENDDAPSTPVNDVSVTRVFYSSASGMYLMYLKG